MTKFARHLLLAAMLLRALVPLGWMPGTAQLGQAAWIICTADGQIQHGSTGKDDASGQHQPCAFAAAHVLSSPQAQDFVAPLPQAAADTHVARAAPHGAAKFSLQSPRAPPISA